MNPVLLWFHRTGSPPNFDRYAARWAPWAFALAFVGFAIGIYGALFSVPADYQQGENFRILYIHVPSAWMSLFIFGVMAIQSFIALVWRIKICEILAMACAPIGAAFTLITLITGSIWGKPTWGTWWTWDPRLTMTVILWTVFAVYLILRTVGRDDPQIARYAAVLALIGVLDIPVLHVSVRLWRGVHPSVISAPASKGGLEDPRMVTGLLVAMAAFALLFVWLLWLRYEGLRLRDELHRLEDQLEETS